MSGLVYLRSATKEDYDEFECMWGEVDRTQPMTVYREGVPATITDVRGPVIDLTGDVIDLTQEEEELREVTFEYFREMADLGFPVEDWY